MERVLGLFRDLGLNPSETRQRRDVEPVPTPVVRPVCGCLVVQLVMGCALFPLTFDDGPPDYSWFAVVALDVLVLGPVAIVFGYLVDMLIVRPIWSLATQSVAAVRGTGTARYRVYFSLLMLGIVALAILLAAGSTITTHGRSIVSLGLALAGVASTDGAGSPVLWAARGAFVLLIALGVGINREYRRLHAGR